MVVRDVAVGKANDRPICEQVKSSAESIRLAMPRLSSSGDRCVKLCVAGGSELRVPTNYNSGSSGGEDIKRKTTGVGSGGAMVANNGLVPNVIESSISGESLP